MLRPARCGLVFFDLPIDSLRYAVGGHDPGHNACVSIIFFQPDLEQHCDDFQLGQGGSPYVVITPDASPPCPAPGRRCGQRLPPGHRQKVGEMWSGMVPGRGKCAISSAGDPLMGFGRNPYVPKAQAAEQKAQEAPDETARARAYREAAHEWDRAAEREKPGKYRSEYEAHAIRTRELAE